MSSCPCTAILSAWSASEAPGGGPLAGPRATQPGPQLSTRLLSRMVDGRISLCGMAGEGVDTWEA